MLLKTVPRHPLILAALVLVPMYHRVDLVQVVPTKLPHVTSHARNAKQTSAECECCKAVSWSWRRIIYISQICFGCTLQNLQGILFQIVTWTVPGQTPHLVGWVPFSASVSWASGCWPTFTQPLIFPINDHFSYCTWASKLTRPNVRSIQIHRFDQRSKTWSWEGKTNEVGTAPKIKGCWTKHLLKQIN